MLMEREFHLLKEAGYFDDAGDPRKGEEGKRIWEFVQMQMKALPPFTDREIDAELWKGDQQ
jgi:hypothetical protein